MKRTNQHIESWINRIIFIGLTLFFLSAFNTENPKDPSNEASPTIAYVMEVELDALSVSSPTLPGYTPTFSTTISGLLNEQSQCRQILQIASAKLKLQIDDCTENYKLIKPKIFRIYSSPNVSLISDEDYALIS